MGGMEGGGREGRVSFGLKFFSSSSSNGTSLQFSD